MTPRLAAVLLTALLVVAGCGSNPSGSPSGASGPCSYPTAGEPNTKGVNRPPATPPSDNPTEMVVSTNAGDIPIAFATDTAPCTVNAFISLAKQGFFNGTRCHRVTTSTYTYILQCGSANGDGTGSPGYTVPDELVAGDSRLQPCQEFGAVQACTFTAGTVAIANRGPDTGNSQFFLVYANSLFPPDYTILGRTDAGGLKVLKAIGARGTDPVTAVDPSDGPPRDPVTITSVR